ncbi:hypothetical protein BVI061214_00482 [Thermus aquaticus]|uniref:DJ-1/PfpI domain-containing protein n=1 Tax=Thermus aquaticus TaxID=271 RepID=A0A0N0BLB2_THEAQ|nr:hypothetical protein BVI061214_00482 [Thermus aquaticus]
MRRIGILPADLFDEDDLVNAGGLYQEAGVVVDGHLVTAQGPKDLPAFLAAFLRLL